MKFVYVQIGKSMYEQPPLLLHLLAASCTYGCAARAARCESACRLELHACLLIDATPVLASQRVNHADDDMTLPTIPPLDSQVWHFSINGSMLNYEQDMYNTSAWETSGAREIHCLYSHDAQVRQPTAHYRSWLHFTADAYCSMQTLAECHMQDSNIMHQMFAAAMSTDNVKKQCWKEAHLDYNQGSCPSCGVWVPRGLIVLGDSAYSISTSVLFQMTSMKANTKKNTVLM